MPRVVWVLMSMEQYSSNVMPIGYPASRLGSPWHVLDIAFLAHVHRRLNATFVQRNSAPAAETVRLCTVLSIFLR